MDQYEKYSVRIGTAACTISVSRLSRQVQNTICCRTLRGHFRKSISHWRAALLKLIPMPFLLACLSSARQCATAGGSSAVRGPANAWLCKIDFAANDGAVHQAARGRGPQMARSSLFRRHEPSQDGNTTNSREDVRKARAPRDDRLASVTHDNRQGEMNLCLAIPQVLEHRERS